MIVGIIAEYNPFHNGHRYQIEQIRKKIKNAVIVVIMSGSFTQRGEPAILDKFTRAKLAVKGGCDLVLELPFTDSVRSAQDFARGGINLLKKLGVVDILAFGAEIDDIKLLTKAAEMIDDVNFKNILRDNLNLGVSYSKAICQTLTKITGINEKILKLPNVILAIEYLRVLKTTSIEPFLISRISANHNDNELHANISSASAIRKAVYSNDPLWSEIAKTVDNDTLYALQNAELPSMEILFRSLLIKITCNNKEYLKNIYGMSEGIENKLIDAAYNTSKFNEFVDYIVSRRYTRSRIQRLILNLIIGVNKERVKTLDEVNYARILAFNQYGRKLIKSIKKTTKIPIITKITQHITSRAIYNQIHNLESYQQKLILDIISTDVLSIICNNIKLRQDFTTSPFYLLN